MTPEQRERLNHARLDAVRAALGALIAILLLAALVGCATKPIPPTVVKEAVIMPCPVAVPDRPVFPADDLALDADIWTLGTALYADRLAREAYEIDLRARLIGCTKP